MSIRFLEIHSLTSYSATLLNRDDAGFAKRLPFGGAIRTRVSSQCLKRHWRVHDGEMALRTIDDAPESVRSRVSFEEYVVKPLVVGGVPSDLAREVANKLIGVVFGSEQKAEKQAKQGKGKEKEKEAAPVGEAKTAQVTVLGRPELDYLAQLARDACQAGEGDRGKVLAALERRLSDKKLKENIAALRPGSLEAGLGAALFGRMVTGDILARTDAAIHVAHAFTVHAQQSESDYFSAIDDLKREEGEQGSGHINASELSSGLFYGYTVVDVPLLFRNLGEDGRLTGEVVERLIHMVATVSPGAKKGSTAPYAYSHLVLVESGKKQPRTLANAFLDPVRTSPSVIKNAYAALGAFLEDERSMYGRRGESAHAAMGTEGTLFAENKRALAEVASWAKAQVVS